MIVIIGFVALVLSIRGILRKEYRFGLGRFPTVAYILKGNLAIATAGIIGIGAILMMAPFICDALSIKLDTDLWLRTFLGGFLTIGIGHFIGWILYRFGRGRGKAYIQPLSDNES